MNKFMFILLFILIPLNAVADLKVYYQTSGNISLSVDGIGTNAELGEVVVRKPEGATVKKIFILAAGTPGRVIKDGDVSVNGKKISWDDSILNKNSRYTFNSVISDGTNAFKDIINGSVAGDITFTVSEVKTSSIDGVIFVVVFNDPVITTTRSVSLFFGGQSTDGDEFFVRFKNKLTETPAILNLGLGVSFGYQSSSGSRQVNIIDINGKRLTSSGGGEDDGASHDGALLTVGGIGDSNENPEPFAPSTHYNTDDELYDLRSFLAVNDDGFILKSNNPSDDDNIFFAYLYSSIQSAALPPVKPPKDLDIVKNEEINKDLPTIILIHGLSEKGEGAADLWTGFKDTQAGGLITKDLGSDVNIIQYIWKDAFHVVRIPDKEEYTAASIATYNAGVNLAKQLIDLLGKDYNKKVHFIGHSLGTIVSTHAISALHSGNKNIKNIQFTALDRPDHVTKIWGISDKDEKELGYHKDFFGLNLPLNEDGFNLVVDNYYAKPSSITFGVGDSASVISSKQKIYNWSLVSPNDVADEIGLDDEGTENDHSGVQQWYRWTMNPNDFNTETYCTGVQGNRVFNKPPSGLMHITLDPCNKGWSWSTNKGFQNFPSSNAPSNIVGIHTSATISAITNFGCTSKNDDGFILTCKEQSSPFSLATIKIPSGTTHISFDYKFDKKGDGDYASVLIDGREVWKMSGASALNEGEFINTGSLPIVIDSGDRSITIALFGVNEKNAEFEIQNIVLHSMKTSVSSNKPPVAVDDILTISSTSKIIDVLANDTDPDGDTLTISKFDAKSTQGGTITKNDNGTLTYTPKTGYIGTDSFTYTISDSNGGTASGTVTITVNPIPNKQPTAKKDDVTTPSSTPKIIDVLANDTDPDGDKLTISKFDAKSTQGGTIIKNDDGTLTYTSKIAYTGSDSFTYTVSDGNGGTATATVNITVEDCFIATAAFGSYLHADVKVLRDFRDNYLLTNSLGKSFVNFYYKNSPPIAGYIAERDTLKVVVRSVLTPIVYIVKYPILLLIFVVSLVLWRKRKVIFLRNQLSV